jgi:hypothetical protein
MNVMLVIVSFLRRTVFDVISPLLSKKYKYAPAYTLVIFPKADGLQVEFCASRNGVCGQVYAHIYIYIYAFSGHDCG